MATLVSVGLFNAAFVTALAVIAYLITKLWRRPALAHGLWLLVLLKLLVPPFYPVPVFAWPAPAMATVATGEEVAGLVPETPAPAADEGAKAAILVDSPTTADAASQDDVATSLPPIQEPEAFAALDVPPAEVLVAKASDWYEPAAAIIVAHWPEALVGLWLTGSLAWLGLALVRVWRFHCTLRSAELAAPITQRQTAVLAEELGLKRCPRVYLVPGQVSPMLWALTGSTRLLLPKGLWSLLSWEQQRTLLVHELAHVRRRDHWVRVVEMFATALYWWHPVTWWAKHELREAEEACCDAWVTSTLPMAQKSYATALLATVDFLAGVRRPLPLAASGVGQVRHLQRRLTMIMNGTTPRSLSRYGCLGVLGLSLTLLPVLPTWAQQPPQERPPDQPDRRGRQERPDQPDRRARQDQPPERGSEREGPAFTGFTGRVAGFPDQSNRDQLEKLEAMLQVKRAEIRKAEVAVKGAEQMVGIGSRSGGVVSEQERNAQRLQLEGAQADLEIKRAEARVVEIEIAQARRRGERFTGMVERPAGPATPPTGATPPASGTPPAVPNPPRGGFGGGFGRTPAPGAPGVGPGAPHPGGPGAGTPGGQGPAGTPGAPGGGAPMLPGASGGSGRPGGMGGFGGGSGGFTPFGGGATRDVERRLDELEKKLNRLLEEMERMRPERPDQPRLRGRGEGGREQPPVDGGRSGPTRRGDGTGRERDDESRPPATPRPPEGNPPTRRPDGREGGEQPVIRT